MEKIQPLKKASWKEKKPKTKKKKSDKYMYSMLSTLNRICAQALVKRNRSVLAKEAKFC